MTCSYTVNIVEKKMTMCKNNSWLSRQNSTKFHIFIAGKGVGLSLDILTIKKSIKTFITEHISDVRIFIACM